ncbi:MAG: cysteine desulfurase [Planctomycetaceae bacterium]|jgi:cysteine desulfurase/selenocysteine lyase|nr:cysteine desulfurase [Planctomycetaceae bacterium]
MQNSHYIPRKDNDAQNDVQFVWREISKTLFSAQAPNTGFQYPVSEHSIVSTPRSALQTSNAQLTPNSRDFDVTAIRRDFPILSEKIHGKDLVWFDNGATTQKPTAVIERLKYFYEHENSNVHRGAHDLAARATDAYENSREIVQKFIKASSPSEIIFVRGTTEGINLVAATWGRDNIHAGDEILISYLEHHANIVPWQHLAQETGAVIKVIPVDGNGDLELAQYAQLLKSGNVKLVALTQVANSIGTITPAQELVHIAHQFGAAVLIDGAQSIAHTPTDVQRLDTDFFVFSGHKIFAPTGIGALYGKQDLLNSMRPYQGGGGMISDVTFEETLYQPAPQKFEAGTGNIADAVGLGAALEYVASLGIEAIRQYEHRLLEYARSVLTPIPGIQIIGNPKERAGVISFVHNRYATEEINKAMAVEGIALRAGHHCAQPILRKFGYESTVRASFAFYNTYEEINVLAKKLADFVSR